MSLGELVLIVCMALAVYAPKALPLVLVSDRITAQLEPWLRYVAPAVLGALVAPSIVLLSGQAPFGFDKLGYLVAVGVALVTRRMVPSLAAGMSVLVLVTVFVR